MHKTVYPNLKAGLSLMLLLGSLTGDALATDLRMTMPAISVNPETTKVAVAYAAPDDEMNSTATSEMEPMQEKYNVSVAAEIDKRTLLAAILGLIGMRLWWRGNKNMPTIE